jgi:ubiquinone/menaquinone biosynthesis C-methylase UbiE
MSVLEHAGRKFARFTTNLVLRWPKLWRLLRAPTRAQFARLAPVWDAMRDPVAFAPLEAGLAAVEPAPTRALDIGTGTGSAAFLVAERFPEAEVVGIDLAGAMLAEARRKTTPELAGRVRFEEADAKRLPFADGCFELVTLANMIPFFDEVERVLAPGGSVLFAFSAGPETPIYVPAERLRSELSRRGFTEFTDFAAGRGTALVARKPGSVMAAGPAPGPWPRCP